MTWLWPTTNWCSRPGRELASKVVSRNVCIWAGVMLCAAGEFCEKPNVREELRIDRVLAGRARRIVRDRLGLRIDAGKQIRPSIVTFSAPIRSWRLEAAGGSAMIRPPPSVLRAAIRSLRKDVAVSMSWVIRSCVTSRRPATSALVSTSWSATSSARRVTSRPVVAPSSRPTSASGRWSPPSTPLERRAGSSWPKPNDEEIEFVEMYVVPYSYPTAARRLSTFGRRSR